MVMPTSTPMLQAPARAAVRTTGLASTVSGRNGSSVETSRQANNAQNTPEVSSNAAVGAEIAAPLAEELVLHLRLPDARRSRQLFGDAFAALWA